MTVQSSAAGTRESLLTLQCSAVVPFCIDPVMMRNHHKSERNTTTAPPNPNRMKAPPTHTHTQMLVKSMLTGLRCTDLVSVALNSST